MLTKDQKDKLLSLWIEGLEKRNRADLIQAWELFQAIDPTDKKLEQKLRRIRNESAIEWASNIEQAVLKIMKKEIVEYTEDSAMLFHDAFPNDSENYKDSIDFLFAQVAKEMKKSPMIKQVDELYKALAYEEIPYKDGGY
jgi:hypothetical protein